MKSRIVLKAISFLVILLLSVNAFAAGTKEKPAGKGESGSADVIEIKFDWETTARSADAKKAVFDAFNATHDKIHANMELIGSGDEYLRTVKAGLATGAKGPDMIRIYGPSAMIPFADAGLILSLDSFYKKYNWANRIPKWAVESHTYKGHLYGLPLNPESLFLYYNKTKFKENGWSAPKTYSELVALCEKIEAKGYTPFSFGVRGFTPANEWWLSVILNQWAGSKNVYKALKGEIALTDESFSASLKNFKTIWDRGWIMNKKMYDITEDDSFAKFADETALMMMTGSWGVKYMDKYVENFEWDIAPFPSGDDVTPVAPLGIGFTVGVNSATQNPEAVGEFLNWLIEDPKRSALIAIDTFTDVWPIVKGSPSKYFPEGFDSRVAWMMSHISEIQDQGRIGYITWTFWPTNTEVYMYENLPNVLFGEVSVEKYLEKSQAVLKEDIDNGRVPVLPAP
jgi:raffinose/stachyose/melibiose transport system substrate-binding protein